MKEHYKKYHELAIQLRDLDLFFKDLEMFGDGSYTYMLKRASVHCPWLYVHPYGTREYLIDKCNDEKGRITGEREALNQIIDTYRIKNKGVKGKYKKDMPNFIDLYYELHDQLTTSHRWTDEEKEKIRYMYYNDNFTREDLDVDVKTYRSLCGKFGGGLCNHIKAGKGEEGALKELRERIIHKEKQRIKHEAYEVNFEERERMWRSRQEKFFESYLGYKEYLQSDWWHEIRQKAKERDGYICQMCGSDYDLQVHHDSYDNKGTEAELEDIVTLCRTCHKKRHNIRY